MGFDFSSFEFKVSEMLKEVELGYGETEAVDRAVSAVRDCIDAISDQTVGADAAAGFVRDLGVPVDKVQFTFRKPDSFEVVGSYSIKCVAKPYVNVDVLIRMPKVCFHEKDYVKFRYHAKRCLYLAVIEKHLKSCSSVRRVEWVPFQNEARKPVLLVYPGIEVGESRDFFIRLIPTATTLFSLSKLNMSRNNVRSSDEGGLTQATPTYNSSILEDMFLEDNAHVMKNLYSGWKDLGDALLLLKVWARHRCFIYSHDALNGFLLAIMLSYLATEAGGNQINRSMKSMQMFRVALYFIATSKLLGKGFSLQTSEHGKLSEEERMRYQEIFPLVLLDKSGHHNLAFRITSSGLKEIREEAAWALAYMDKSKDEGFEEIFMEKTDFAAKFDYCMRINLHGCSKVYESGFLLDDECWRTYEKKVHYVLEKGLLDRVKLIRVIWKCAPSNWNIESGFQDFGQQPLFVGILATSAEKCFRIIDVGPHAENKAEVSIFRKFWGEKAELRRFKDGTIAESTVWACSQGQRHLIIRQISEYVLARHLLLTDEHIVHFVDQLDFCLLHGMTDPSSFSGNLLKAFEELSRRLRQLGGIPLQVSNVQPLDAALRQTAVFPPKPHSLAYENDSREVSGEATPVCIQSMDVLIQLEGSGNWPLNDDAIEKTKTAFLLKIGDSLEKKWSMKCVASENEVNVLMSGYSFRLMILHERGLSLVKKQDGSTKNKKISCKDTKLFFRSQHASMINGLQGCYPLYGPVTRLAKRWVTSHFFSSYLCEEAIELLVAHLFIKPYPFYAPCSRISGFIRFLRLLSNYDWSFCPLLVDINNDFTLDDVKEINDNFASSRKLHEENSTSAELAMYLATSYDKTSQAWTKFSPTRMVLRRISAYARSSDRLLTNMILDSHDNVQRWECLFRTPLTNYDAVVLLHRDKLAHSGLLFPSEMNQGKCVVKGKASKNFCPHILKNGFLKYDEMKSKLLVNFDPSKCFLEDIKKEYSGRFSLWYDSLGGDAIGLTWNRSAFKKRGRDEAEDGQDCIELLKNVGHLGKGYVRSIYFLRAPKVSRVNGLHELYRA